MGGTSTTVAQLPREASPLMRKTFANMAGLQDYFWGGLPGSTTGNPYRDINWEYDPNTGEWTPKNKVHGTSTPVLGPASAQDRQVPLPPGGGDPGGGGIVTYPGSGPTLPGSGPPTIPIPAPIPNPPPNDGSNDPPSGDGGDGSIPGFSLSDMLGYNPAEVPELSEFQQAMGEYIPKLVQAPVAEQAAHQWIDAGMGEATQSPEDYGLWTHAGQVPTIASAFEPVLGPAKAMDGASAQGAGVGTGAQYGNLRITDPSIVAAKELFDNSIAENIRTSMQQQGLGGSTYVGDSLARGWGDMLLPLMQDTMSRKERATERQLAQAEANLGRDERAIERGQRAREFGTGTFMEMGARDTGRLTDALGWAERYGALQRGVEQEKSDAEQAEQARLQALAEWSLGAPFGALPSTIGSKTSK